MSANLARTRQYATFRVEGLFLAVEVVKVQEIIRYQEMTVVPLAPNPVEGLINLRGQIVIAIDTRRSLGLPVVNRGNRPINVVIQSPDGVTSLLVDEIGDVVDLPLDAYGPVPDNMPAEQRELIEGVYNLDEGMLLVLDTGRLLQNACL